LIGSLEEPEVKAEGMLAHRASGKCWTSKYCNDAEVYYLALDNHLCSKRLHKLSKEKNILFINIKSTDFENSVKHGVKIISDLALQQTSKVVV